MRKQLITPYFPVELKYGSLIFIAVSVYLAVINHPVWAVVLAVLAAVFYSTRYVTTIDTGNRTITDYISICGLPVNRDVLRYGTIDRIVITKGNYAQTLNTRVQSRQIDWSDYTATLLFHHNEPFDILTKTGKRELLLSIRDLAVFLNAEVEDLTTREPYFIDLTRVE